MRANNNPAGASLDYRAMIYAAIVATPWRFADLGVVERSLLWKHGPLGHLTVCEFRAAAILAAQAYFEGPAQIYVMQNSNGASHG